MALKMMISRLLKLYTYEGKSRETGGNKQVLLIILLMAAFMMTGWPLIAAGDDTKQTSLDISIDKETAMSEKKPIVLLGASYAKGVKSKTLKGHQLINKGVGGDQSSGMLARFDSDVLALAPAKVIIWGFINDIFRSEKDQLNETLERIKANFVEMISLAQANGIEPIVATEITMGPRPGFKELVGTWLGKVRGKTSYQEFINGHVMQINRWLKEYAGEHGLQVLDIQALLAEGGVMRNKKYVQEDGSHVSEQGYASIADYFEDTLK